MKYKKNLDTLLTKVDNYFVLVKESEIFKINEISARIIDLIDGEKEVDEIIRVLQNFYKKEDDLIKEEIKSFISTLEDNGLIERG